MLIHLFWPEFRPENWWGCAAGRWKLDPKRSRKKLNLGPKRSIFVKIGSFCIPKDSFAVGGWEKVPQKDRARSCQSEKRGSKPRHICITHHIGSTPPPPPPPPPRGSRNIFIHNIRSSYWWVSEKDVTPMRRGNLCLLQENERTDSHEIFSKGCTWGQEQSETFSGSCS